ncbi:hypothetical protein [Microbispora sp. H10836]|uniref:hypothetical protein n=1 Tax=Microbispora sp. H10836 TaxID=2729106 RepID=UPI001473E24E|nr:hypothetical protein [Microbispora sp. H10836]
MSRSRGRDPRHPNVAMALATRWTTLAALVITAAGIAAAQPAIARVAPHHPPHGVTALRDPGPGRGGGQVIRGGRAGGAQGRSGQGHYNQSLNGVISPTFVRGQAQQAITDQGGFEVQSVLLRIAAGQLPARTEHAGQQAAVTPAAQQRPAAVSGV